MDSYAENNNTSESNENICQSDNSKQNNCCLKIPQGNNNITRLFK